MIPTHWTNGQENRLINQEKPVLIQMIREQPGKACGWKEIRDTKVRRRRWTKWWNNSGGTPHIGVVFRSFSATEKIHHLVRVKLLPNELIFCTEFLIHSLNTALHSAPWWLKCLIHATHSSLKLFTSNLYTVLQGFAPVSMRNIISKFFSTFCKMIFHQFLFRLFYRCGSPPKASFGHVWGSQCVPTSTAKCRSDDLRVSITEAASGNQSGTTHED